MVQLRSNESSLLHLEKCQLFVTGTVTTQGNHQKIITQDIENKIKKIICAQEEIFGAQYH